MRARGTITLVLLLALGVCASSASAEPLGMTFTESRANVGIQLEDEALFGPPDTAPLTAQIDPGSGAITAGDLTVPRFSTDITDPIVANVTVDFAIGEIDGSFVAATGALSLKGTAGGTLTAQTGTFAGEECTVSTTPAILELSTAGEAADDGSPRSGAPFAKGLTGPGSIAGQWTDMQATPVAPLDMDNVDFCNNVETQIGGLGGVWLDQEGDLVPPPAPQLSGTAPASPDLDGAPRIRGSAEAGSTVRIYAGEGCAGAPVATGSAARLGSPGIAVGVGEGVTASFSATAADAAAHTSACSAPISYTRLKVTPPPPPPPPCIVPKLVGTKLRVAKKKIRAAGCTVGQVHRPRRSKGKGRLVVKSSNPRAGATRPAGAKVHLRLGPKSR